MFHRFARRLAATTVATAALTGLIVGGAAAPAQAQTKLPVPYSFAPALLAALQPYASPPGANDYTCKPSAAHPRPVVLVHGLTGNKNTNWQTMSPLLKNEGYCVFALTYGNAGLTFPFDQFGGLNAMEDSAAQLGTFIDGVLAATGASKVDIVGHSEGTVVPNYYAKYLGGASKIDQYVSIAPIWNGTNLLGLGTISQIGSPFGLTALVNAVLQPFFASGPQLLTGSAFMAKQRAGGTPIVPGIRYTNFVTKYDQLVIPYTSGVEPGMTNIEIQKACPIDYSEHFQIVASPTTAQLLLNTLDPTRNKPVTCRLVLPIIGAL